MEAIAQPRRWEDFPNLRDQMFRSLRSPEGERMIFEENFLRGNCAAKEHSAHTDR